MNELRRGQRVSVEKQVVEDRAYRGEILVQETVAFFYTLPSLTFFLDFSAQEDVYDYRRSDHSERSKSNSGLRLGSTSSRQSAAAEASTTDDASNTSSFLKMAFDGWADHFPLTSLSTYDSTKTSKQTSHE